MFNTARTYFKTLTLFSNIISPLDVNLAFFLEKHKNDETFILFFDINDLINKRIPVNNETR